MFSGPGGCGKTRAARILAKALNCEKGPSAKPCGVCRSCVEIARGASLDVIEIDGASNTSVDDVRQIKDEVLFAPNGGRYKVYIIDEVHMLSNSAFNALLKTIEEPPPYIVFIFATTEVHKVPATIKSRCQQFAFRLFKVELIQELLASAAADIDVVAEPEALLWIAKESGGSLRDAYTLFDQVVAFSDGKMSSALILDKLGLTGLDVLGAFSRRAPRATQALPSLYSTRYWPAASRPSSSPRRRPRLPISAPPQERHRQGFAARSPRLFLQRSGARGLHGRAPGARLGQSPGPVP